jgi:hypothetical protein
MISRAYRSNDQTLASTPSSAVDYTTGEVSGTNSNSGAVTLRSGNSVSSGNSGNVIISSGTATSGNSGNIIIDSGTASATKGSITVGSVNTPVVNVGTHATDINFGDQGTGLTASVFRFANGINSGLFFLNSTTDASHIQYAMSKRSNNLDLWYFAQNGTTFWNYLKTDWANKALTFEATSTFQNTSNSTAAFNISNASSISLFTVDTTNSRVYIGNPTSDTTGAVLVLDRKSSAGDPTGLHGAMYYNESLDKFRCYEASEWRNCVSNVTTRGVATQAPTGPTSTTSATYVNMPGTSSVAFTKEDGSTKLVVTLNVSAFAAAAATIAQYGILVAGTDYNCTQLFYNTANEHAHVSCTIVIDSIAAGAQTIQARWKRSGVVGNITQDAGDWLNLTVQETF